MDMSKFDEKGECTVKKIFNITLGKVGQIGTEKHNANPTKILVSSTLQI